MAQYDTTKDIAETHIYSAVGQLADIMINFIKVANFGDIMSPEMKMEWIHNTITQLEQIKENDEKYIRGK